MKTIAIPFLIAALTLAACAPAPDSPVSSDTPSAPSQSDYLPKPGDGSLTRGEAYLDSIDLLTLESYPLQFMLNLKGSLPTPCHQLRIAAEPPDTANKVVVDVYSVSNPGDICVQMLQPFEVNFPLGSYPQGHYTLFVNGEQVAEFDA